MIMLPNDIITKCEKFKDQNNEFNVFRRPMWICGFIAVVFGLTWTVMSDEEYYNLEFFPELDSIIGGLSLIFFALAILLRAKANSKRLKLNERAALRTYKTHTIISDYLTRSPYEPNLDKAKGELSSLGFEATTDWSEFEKKNNILSTYMNDIDTFMTNLQKIDTVFDKKDISLENFQTFLIDLIKFFLGYPNIDITTLNQELKNYVILEQKDNKKSETLKRIISEHPILKFVWIPPVISTIIYSIFMYVDPQDIKTALTVALVIGTTISVGIATKRNSFK